MATKKTASKESTSKENKLKTKKETVAKKAKPVKEKAMASVESKSKKAAAKKTDSKTKASAKTVVVKTAVEPKSKKAVAKKTDSKTKASPKTIAAKKTKAELKPKAVETTEKPQIIEQAEPVEQLKAEQPQVVPEPKIEQPKVVVQQQAQVIAQPQTVEQPKVAVQPQAEVQPQVAPQSKPAQSPQAAEQPKYIGTINITELVTVRDLSEKMKLKVGDVLKKLMSMGSLATINQRLDTDTAVLLAHEFGWEAKLVSIYEEEESVAATQDSPENLLPRSPIVTIMGHVDHGKTSLLDAVRDSSVAAGEHGGITQHIGAYRVNSDSGSITFLDTPGHEAFTAMRSRGAQATDIVILVVSATDGVQPQTIEAINHAKAADVPIIVAVNKIDLPGARPDNIRTELANYGLNPEEWGGDTIMVDVSAKQRLNIDSLLEMVLLKAEMMELKANPKKKAEGVVVEAKLDSKRGPVATLLVQSGTLRIGDNIVVGTTFGKVRAMTDDKGKRFTEALPAWPAEILGINEPPQAGDKFAVVEHESQAREIAQARREKVKADALRPRHHLSLEDISSGKAKDLRIVLKTDVQGSLGALCDALERMSNNEINLKIIHKGAGGITESDVALAAASDALIVGFNIRPDAIVEKLAETEGVSINVYRIIYELIADIKAAMEGLLDPDMKEKIIGKALVKQVFKLSSSGVISGCQVIEGKAVRGNKARLVRDNIIVFEGNVSSLKRFKEDAKEVDKGYECGIGLENFADIKSGDIIEFFVIEKTARKLVD